MPDISLNNAVVFDIEANGLLSDATQIWCIVLNPFYSNDVIVIEGDDLLNTKYYFSNYDILIGHNIINYDIPMLEKFYKLNCTNKIIYDTFLMSNLSYADRQLPENCPTHYTNPVTNRKEKIGPHSLESWMYRVNSGNKVHISDWREYTPDIKERCISDTLSNKEIFKALCEEMLIKI